MFNSMISSLKYWGKYFVLSWAYFLVKQKIIEIVVKKNLLDYASTTFFFVVIAWKIFSILV